MVGPSGARAWGRGTGSGAGQVCGAAQKPSPSSPGLLRSPESDSSTAALPALCGVRPDPGQAGPRLPRAGTLSPARWEPALGLCAGVRRWKAPPSAPRWPPGGRGGQGVHSWGRATPRPGPCWGGAAPPDRWAPPSRAPAAWRSGTGSLGIPTPSRAQGGGGQAQPKVTPLEVLARCQALGPSALPKAGAPAAAPGPGTHKPQGENAACHRQGHQQPAGLGPAPGEGGGGTPVPPEPSAARPRVLRGPPAPQVHGKSACLTWPWPADLQTRRSPRVMTDNNKVTKALLYKDVEVTCCHPAPPQMPFPSSSRLRALRPPHPTGLPVSPAPHPNCHGFKCPCLPGTWVHGGRVAAEKLPGTAIFWGGASRKGVWGGAESWGAAGLAGGGAGGSCVFDFHTPNPPLGPGPSAGQSLAKWEFSEGPE